MKFSLFTIAMVMAAYTTTVNAVPIHSVGQADADMDDLEPRAARSIIAANGCCPTAGCKRARSVFEPYCSTGCYGDKPWLHLPCATGVPCDKQCGAAEAAKDPKAAAAVAGKSAGAKAAEDVTKNINTDSIASQLTKHMKD